MLPRAKQQGQVPIEGPRGSSCLIGTIVAQRGSHLWWPSRRVREHNPPSLACTQRDRWALVHITPPGWRGPHYWGGVGSARCGALSCAPALRPHRKRKGKRGQPMGRGQARKARASPSPSSPPLALPAPCPLLLPSQGGQRKNNNRCISTGKNRESTRSVNLSTQRSLSAQINSAHDAYPFFATCTRGGC